MDKKARKIKINFSQVSPGQKVVFLIVLIVSISIQVISITNIRNKAVESQKQSATIYAEILSADIASELETYVSTTQILKNFYNQYGGMFINDFSSVCSKLQEDNVAIGRLCLAPGGVVQVIYPPQEEGESIIGHNILTDSSNNDRAKLAIVTKKPTIMGPQTIRIGSKEIDAIMIRNPIFYGEEFTGFSIVIVDSDILIESLLSKIEKEKAGYYFGVWKDNNENISTDEHGFIFRDTKSIQKNINVSKNITVKVNVPNDNWYISVEPISGWYSYKNMWLAIIISIILVVSILSFTLYRILEYAKKLYTFEHDSLTGLYTRSAFYRRVQKKFEEFPDESFDIVMADIAHFKVVNSVHGVDLCDELLKYLAQCFLQDSYDSICARFSGDQFIFLLRSKDNRGREFFEERAKAILENSPINHINIKYGFYGNVDKTVKVNLLADRALVAAKSILNNYERIAEEYGGDISKKLLREQVLESKFSTAIDNKDFHVWFQPKHDAHTKKLVGAEALVRWFDNKEQIFYSPVEFISVFEKDGLIYHLDTYVFERVCSQIKYWIDKNVEILPISINISRSTLHRPGIVEEYKNIADRIGVPLDYVPLEITESIAYRTAEIKNLGQNFRDAGFKLHMDDFGTGSSSLASLNILEFDVIKIDKSLVDFIGTSDGDELLSHIIELAHFKNVKVVAEGVETVDQLNFLQSLNCDYIQGYYFSKPMCYEEFINYIKNV